MSTGTWTVDVSKNLPQKIATAMSALNETMVGAEYEEILYLGHQTVNGINHAVLAQQLLTTGVDTRNVVLLIFNEKPNTLEAVLVAIERIVGEGSSLGGVKLNPTTDISNEMMQLWAKAFEGRIGARFRPVSYLGQQSAEGTNYIFVTLLEDIGPGDNNNVCLTSINPMTQRVIMSDILEDRQTDSLGYAFSW